MQRGEKRERESLLLRRAIIPIFKKL